MMLSNPEPRLCVNFRILVLSLWKGRLGQTVVVAQLVSGFVKRLGAKSKSHNVRVNTTW